MKNMAHGDVIHVGDAVRIKRGLVGEGYRFTVAELSRDAFGKPVAYGHGYGPRWVDELEVIQAQGLWA